MYSVAGPQHALTMRSKGHAFNGQGHWVMKCAASMGIYAWCDWLGF